MRPEDYEAAPDPWWGRVFNGLVNGLAWIVRA